MSTQERAEAIKDPSHPVNMLRMVDVDALLQRKGARFLNDVDVVKWVSFLEKIHRMDREVKKRS